MLIIINTNQLHKTSTYGITHDQITWYGREYAEKEEQPIVYNVRGPGEQERRRGCKP